MDLAIDGHVAIVTGASRGLGFAAAQALADEGVRVLVTARTQTGLDALVESRPGRIVAVACEITNRADVEALPQQAVDAFGRLDIVVNNAGIAPAGSFLEQDPEDVERGLPGERARTGLALAQGRRAPRRAAARKDREHRVDLGHPR